MFAWVDGRVSVFVQYLLNHHVEIFAAHSWPGIHKKPSVLSWELAFICSSQDVFDSPPRTLCSINHQYDIYDRFLSPISAYGEKFFHDKRLSVIKNYYPCSPETQRAVDWPSIE